MSNISVNINLKKINGENPVGEGDIIIDKEALGLENVDNTSDADKPVSVAMLSALNNKEDKANKKTDLSAPNDITYPTTKAVSDAIGAIHTGDDNVQSDWNQTNTSADDFIKNKPALLELGETSTKAYRGDRGKTAYNHSQLTSGNPHGVSKSDVGLGNVNNTSDANKPISTATATALNGKEDKANKKTSLSSPNNTTYPTTKAVSDFLDEKISDKTISIRKNGVLKGTFTLNSSSGKEIDIGKGIVKNVKEIITRSYVIDDDDEVLLVTRSTNVFLDNTYQPIGRCLTFILLYKPCIIYINSTDPSHTFLFDREGSSVEIIKIENGRWAIKSSHDL